MYLISEKQIISIVALYARAWVEINNMLSGELSKLSPSTRGRGLK